MARCAAAASWLHLGALVAAVMVDCCAELQAVEAEAHAIEQA